MSHLVLGSVSPVLKKEYFLLGYSPKNNGLQMSLDETHTYMTLASGSGTCLS